MFKKVTEYLFWLFVIFYFGLFGIKLILLGGILPIIFGSALVLFDLIGFFFLIIREILYYASNRNKKDNQ